MRPFMAVYVVKSMAGSKISIHCDHTDLGDKTPSQRGSKQGSADIFHHVKDCGKKGPADITTK